ncbi:hypothetical protein Tco_0448820 [Tanacetum coccineum]
MGDENPRRTLGDYSRPSHEGYRNTIEVPNGNDLAPLRSDTIRLVQNGCSFHGLRSEDPNQHLKDFLKIMDSIDLNVETRKGRACALLEDLTLYDNESWNDPRDFAKPVKAISMPNDVPSTSDRRLIELENQVQRMTEAHLSQSKLVQVNKIASSCEICSGPYNTQYCMEDLERAFVEYASTRTDETLNKWYTFKPEEKNLGDTYNPSWKSHPNLRWRQPQNAQNNFSNPPNRFQSNGSYPNRSFNNTSQGSNQSNLKGKLANFMASQDAKTSRFEADFKQYQSEVTNKLDAFFKAFNDQMTGLLPSDTVKNSKLNTNPTSSAVAVVVMELYKKFYNSLGRVPNRCSSSIGKTRGLLSFSRGIVITESLVNISKRHAFWSINEDILKINDSDYQYAISIKEDTAYPCLHSTKTTKETSSIRRIQRRPIRRIKDIVCEDSGRYQAWIEEEKARKHGKVFNWKTAKYGRIWYDEDVHDLKSIENEFPALAFNDSLKSGETLSCEPAVSSLNDEIDFRISFDDFDDEDYMVVFNKNSFSYKIISTNDLKTDSENDNEKVMPLLPSPEPTVSYFDDLDFFKYFENEFPTIVYNDTQTSKSDLLTEPILSPQHIDEFDLNDETSFSEYDKEEQNVLSFNDLFSFNVIYPNDSKSDKDNDDELMIKSILNTLWGIYLSNHYLMISMDLRMDRSSPSKYNSSMVFHMANLKYSNKHNMVAFLKKPNESVGFTEVVDFLKGTSLRSYYSKEYPITKDIDDDPLVSLVRESMKEKSTDFVTPTKASGEAQEEEISPTILQAAKTLSKVASQGVSKEKLTDKGKRYRGRARSMAKNIDTGLDDEEEINTGREEINTGIEKVSTGSTKVSASEDWDTIRAKLEANAELSKDVLGQDLPKQDFAKRMVDMVNQRKKYFA